jgi:hypothetical protein
MRYPSTSQLAQVCFDAVIAHVVTTHAVITDIDRRRFASAGSSAVITDNITDISPAQVYFGYIIWSVWQRCENGSESPGPARRRPFHRIVTAPSQTRDPEREAAPLQGRK